MQETIGNDTVEYHGVRFVVKLNGEVGRRKRPIVHFLLSLMFLMLFCFYVTTRFLLLLLSFGLSWGRTYEQRIKLKPDSH